MRNVRPASRRSCRGCSNWAGSTAATCGSTSAGPRAMPDDSQICGGIGLRSRRTSFWPRPPRAWGRCCRRPAPCRSCSRVVSDPVAAGFVQSLARPGGNATGFMQFEYGLSGKWLELLKQIAPGVTRAAVLRDPEVRNRHQPVCRHPGRGAVAQGRGKPGQRARRRARSARRRSLRALSEWRSDRDGERVGGASSRFDHYASGSTPIAGGLLRSPSSSPPVA